MVKLADRLPAALVFGAAGLLLPAVWFLPVIRPADDVARTLYVWLPGATAAVAGALGAPWLDPIRCRNPGAAALRGIGLAAGALLVFAPLFAFGIWWSEPGWTNPAGLAILVLWLSLLTIGWAVAGIGALAGWIVWRWRGRARSAS
jgi:hypothetical protein